MDGGDGLFVWQVIGWVVVVGDDFDVGIVYYYVFVVFGGDQFVGVVGDFGDGVVGYGFIVGGVDVDYVVVFFLGGEIDYYVGLGGIGIGCYYDVVEEDVQLLFLYCYFVGEVGVVQVVQWVV